MNDIFDNLIQKHQLANRAKTHAKMLFKPAIARELCNAIDALEEIKAICPPDAKDKLCHEILAIEYVGNLPPFKSDVAEQACDCDNSSRAVVAGLVKLAGVLLGVTARLLRGGPVVEAERRGDAGVIQPPSGNLEAA
jgi:hypothetical protein